MTAIDQAYAAAAATSQGVAIEGQSPAEASKTQVALPEPAEDEQLMLRIEDMPRDVGWMLVYVGVLGLILPGIVGTPFLVAGAAMLVPGGTKRLSRWVGRNRSPFVRASVKQLGRMLDDVDRRYPRLP